MFIEATFVAPIKPLEGGSDAKWRSAVVLAPKGWAAVHCCVLAATANS